MIALPLVTALVALAVRSQTTLIPPSPAPPPATLEQARALANSGNFAAAEASLRRYLQTDELSAPAHYLLGYVLLRQNHPRDSLAQYTLAARIHPPSARDLQSVAQDYALLDDLDDAAKWMTKSTELAPGDPDAWYGLGRIRYSQQRFPDALTSFRKALALSPENPKAENNLGLALEALNRPSEAIAAYRSAVLWQQRPGASPSEQPLLNLGIALVHAGSPTEALPFLEQARTLAPHDPRVREQLGHLYLDLNRLPEAQAELEAAVSLSPNLSSLHFLLGQVYRRRGLATQSAAEFTRASALASTHSN